MLIFSGLLVLIIVHLIISAHQEALKREIERLRQVYHQQSLKKMENNNVSDQSPADIKPSVEKEQLLNA